MNQKTNFEKCKSFLKSFTPYQIGYLATVLVLAMVFTIFFPEMMLESTGGTFLIACSVINVIANPVCELLIAKQSKWNFIVDLVFIEGTYVALALALGWYTLAMTCIFFWIPIDIISFIRWSKYPDAQDENLTQVKSLGWKKGILVMAGVVVFSLVAGSITMNIPGAESSYLEAFASAMGMVNGVLLLMRYSEQWYAWFATLVMYTILYTVSGSYIMLITVAAMFVPQWQTNTPIFCMFPLLYRLYFRNALVIACWGSSSSSSCGIFSAGRWFSPCCRITARRTASMSFAGSTFLGQRSTQAKQLRHR